LERDYYTGIPQTARCMQYFTDDFLNFFYLLSQNNNRDWFNQNRKMYEQEVREPFKVFVADLAKAIRDEMDPNFQLLPKDAIFRINRDIRFSADKTPYKEHVGAIITSGGRKTKEEPGYYIQLSGGSLIIGGGAYFMEKESLYNLRKHLITNGKEFDLLLAEKDFKKKYGEIMGKKNKRLPKELMVHVEENPLILNKQFYYMAELPPKKIISKKILPTVMDYFHTARPIYEFLKNAIT